MAKPDWEAIESAYRAGLLSLREIGAKHGVSEGASRAVFELAKAQLEDKAFVKKFDEDAKFKQFQALIIGWSLDEEFTPDNLKLLLTESPNVKERVNNFAANRAEFFKKKPPVLSDTRLSSESSTKSKKTEKA